MFCMIIQVAGVNVYGIFIWDIQITAVAWLNWHNLLYLPWFINLNYIYIYIYWENVTPY